MRTVENSKQVQAAATHPMSIHDMLSTEEIQPRATGCLSTGQPLAPANPAAGPPTPAPTALHQPFHNISIATCLLTTAFELQSLPSPNNIPVHPCQRLLALAISEYNLVAADWSVFPALPLSFYTT